MLNLDKINIYIKLTWIPIALILIWLGYKTFGPTRYQVDMLLRVLADQIVGSAVNEIPKYDGIHNVAVLNLKGDFNGYVTDSIRRDLTRSGKFRVLGKSLHEKLADEFNWERKEVSTLDEALDRGNKIGSDAVVFGEVPSLMQDEDEAKMELILRIADVKNQKALFIKDYSKIMKKKSTSIQYVRSKIAGSSLVSKIFIWIIFAVFLPLATFFIAKKVLKRESNFYNFLLLFGYTLLSFLFAIILAGFFISGLWTSLLLILALGLSGIYNYFALNFIEKYS